MSNPLDETAVEYARRFPLQQEFTDRLKELIRTLLLARAVDFDALESRTKSPESVREKMRRKGYADPLAEITDLTGIRIIVYYVDDLDTVGRLIENEFVVDLANSVDKGSVLQPHEFGYQSLHYVVHLTKQRRTLSEWKRFESLTAEIQVRTVLQHAWAAISHKLQYKRAADIPNELRRRLFRLSALLELADEEFESVRDRTTSLSQSVSEQLAKGVTNLELDWVSLDKYLTTAPEVKDIAQSAVRIGFDVMDIGMAPLGSSETLGVLRSLGLATVGALSTILKHSRPWVEEYLKALFVSADKAWSVSVGFLVQLVVMGKLKEEVSVNDLLSNGWHRHVVERVLSVAKKLRTGEG